MAIFNTFIGNLIYADGLRGNPWSAFLGGLSAHLPFMLVFGWAYSSWQLSEERQAEKLRLLEVQKNMAEEARMVAEEKKAIAEQQWKIAEEQRALTFQKKIVAEREREAADTKRELAEQQKAIAEEKQLILEKERETAQHRLLQSQLSPHLMFNSLNNIMGMVEEDPEKAVECLEAFSDFLRGILETTKRDDFMLEEERDLVEDYLAIRKMGLQGPLRVTWDWDQNLDGIYVPPLMVQTLAENAIKHGISPLKTLEPHDLHFVLRQDGPGTRIQVKNTGTPLDLSKKPDSGVGVVNLRQRLLHAFGPDATLSLYREGSWTVADIYLPVLMAPTEECEYFASPLQAQLV